MERIAKRKKGICEPAMNKYIYASRPRFKVILNFTGASLPIDNQEQDCHTLHCAFPNVTQIHCNCIVQ